MMSMSNCWSLAHRGKAGYYIQNGILYLNERILNFEYEQLCLPISHRDQANKLAHETFGGHFSAKKTEARLILSFTWPTIAMDVRKACQVCSVCQKRRRATVFDRVPISAMARDDAVFN